MTHDPDLASSTRGTFDTSVAPTAWTTILALIEASRPLHATKNLLIFLPLLASHRYVEPQLVRSTLIAFLSFSMAAAATYIINDIRDVQSDRLHPTKRRRPFASDRVTPTLGLMWAGALALIAVVLGAILPPAFLGFLGVYVVATLAYSFGLKRMVVLDVLIIAGLFSVRVLAGGAADGIRPSFWLLAFSMFVFLSIALVKRVTELRSSAQRATHELPGRGYRAEDQSALMAMGIASGFVAILIVALYVNSPDVRVLYRVPDLIWLACPIGLYVIARLWFLALRGEVDEDPVIFVLKDRASQVAILLVGLVAVLAR
jgi:4-hydroxybenzoate polyprenyltransferase